MCISQKLLVIHKHGKSKRQSRTIVRSRNSKSIIFPHEESFKLNLCTLFQWKDWFSIAVCWTKDEWMLKQYNPLRCSGVLYLMRPSGAVSLTVPVFGGSLDMLVSITFPDLISLLCFPVQLHSISPTVGNSDSYINLLSTHWQQRGCRERRSRQRKRGRGRDKDRNVEREREREQMTKDCLYSMFVSKKSWLLFWKSILWKMSMWKSMRPNWVWKQAVWEVTLSTVCSCLLVTWARWFCQAVRAEWVRETTFATVLLL